MMKQICTLLLLLISVARCEGQAQAQAPKGRILDPKIINTWYCPDAVKEFPPLDIKSWNKTQAISNRLATYDEEDKGKALLYIDTKVNPNLKDARAYKMALPKLAYITNQETQKSEIVVVVQMVQFSKCVWVGYRFLTGGVGSCTLDKCRFLTDAEVKKAVG